MKNFTALLHGLLLGCLLTSCAGGKPNHGELDKLTLPAGFSIEIYSDQVPGARSMALGPDGTLYVGTRGDKVYALPDHNHDHKPDRVIEIIHDKNMPNGVAMRGKDLYVAEIDKVTCYPDIGAHLDAPGEGKLLTDKLPHTQMHGWKFIRFGPDGLLYIPVGAPGNVLICNDPFASMLRMKPDGTGLEIYARGIRNTVGFDWHPQTHELWFTENGRDLLGDELPPEEINRAPRAGMHFGYPYVFGQNQPDPEFGKKAPADLKFTPPEVELEAHVAPLGMRFYTGKMFPQRYQGSIILACHGSWNRSEPLGYRLVLVELGQGKPARSIFIEGWLQNGKAWGRPVDVEILDDGSLLVSDDEAGRIYRITYTKP